MSRFFNILLFLFCLCAPAFSYAAWPPDCAHITNEKDWSVCEYVKLADAKKDLSDALKETSDSLSTEGKAELKKSQDSWLTYVELVTKLEKGRDELDGHLKDIYRSRIRDFKKAVVNVGPYKIANISFYKAAKATRVKDGRSLSASVATWEATIPWIDSPKNADVYAFNKKMLSGINFYSNCDGSSKGNQELDKIEIKSASSKIISYSEQSWFYCYGAAHGYGGDSNTTFFLSPNLHKLIASDLFKDGTDWQKILADFCQKEGSKYNIEMDDRHIQNIANTVKYESSWQLDPKGLIIKMPFETIPEHPIDDEMQDVLVPWGVLASVLKIDPQTLFD